MGRHSLSPKVVGGRHHANGHPYERNKSPLHVNQHGGKSLVFCDLDRAKNMAQGLGLPCLVLA
jgi:hypothetical protein